MENEVKTQKEVCIDPRLKALFDGTRKNLSTYVNNPEVRECVEGKLFLEGLVKKHPELINI